MTIRIVFVHKAIAVLALCFLAAAAAPPLKAQAVYGSIIGTVTDQTGAAVNGATVTF